MSAIGLMLVANQMKGDVGNADEADFYGTIYKVRLTRFCVYSEGT